MWPPVCPVRFLEISLRSGRTLIVKSNLSSETVISRFVRFELHRLEPNHLPLEPEW